MQLHHSIPVRKINLDFVNADIHSIFRLISHVSKLNIVTGDDVNGKISVRMMDVPWDQALAAILQARGLGSQRFGNIIRVCPTRNNKIRATIGIGSKKCKRTTRRPPNAHHSFNYATASYKN